MRRARVAHAGAVHEAVVSEDGLTLALADGRKVPENDVVWLPPTTPGTIVALGLNYADHARELAFKAPEEPLIFLKGPNALAGHKAKVRRPSDANQMHYECELVAVIGKTARNVSRADAMQAIAGYTVANDYVIREYLENYYRPNLRAKNRDGLTPVGPWMVDRDDIADPKDLKLRTTVNGKVTQEGTTGDMIFDIPFLVEYLTGFMTLYPGDLILTGTPEGVVYLNAGDEVVTEIEGVGRLLSHVVSDEAFYAEGRAR